MTSARAGLRSLPPSSVAGNSTVNTDLTSIDTQDNLYVIRSAAGVSCLGFGVVQKRLLPLAREFGVAVPDMGTEEHYRLYRSLSERGLERMRVHGIPTPEYQWNGGTAYDIDTLPAVCRVLEAARTTGAWIRVWYGDTETGRSWMDSHDVSGRVERSMGPIRVPLLVRPGATDGPQMLDHCILKIRSARGVLYEHPRFHQPVLRLVTPGDQPGFAATVHADGEVWARFRSADSARRYIDYMEGRRLRP